MHLGEGQCEAGDATGAEDYDGLAGFDAAGLDHRVPRGQRRARQGRRFLETQMFGKLDRAGLIEQRVFGEDTVDHAAERILRGIGGNTAGNPVDEERAANAVAGLELGDAGTDRDDFAGAIG